MAKDKIKIRAFWMPAHLVSSEHLSSFQAHNHLILGSAGQNTLLGWRWARWGWVCPAPPAVVLGQRGGKARGSPSSRLGSSPAFGSGVREGFDPADVQR